MTDKDYAEILKGLAVPVHAEPAMDRAIELLEQGSCEDWYDIPSEEMTLEQARQAVKDLRKNLAECLKQEPFMNKPCVAHQVCHEDKVKVLDKIRTEIAEEAKCTMNDNRAGGLYRALQIIDKYKAEGEEEK